MATIPPRSRGLQLLATMVLVAATAVLNLSVRPAAAAPAISGTVGAPDATTFGRTVTFTGSVTNGGTVAGVDDFTSVSIVDDGSTGLAILSISSVGALAASPPPGPPPPPSTTGSFTVTARVTALPGASAQLKLKATGATADPGVADPTTTMVTSFTVTDPVVLTVTAQRLQGGVASPCEVGTCTVSIDDGLKYTVKVENFADPATIAVVTITAPVPPNTTNLPTSTVPTADVALVGGTNQTFVREVTVNDPSNDLDPPQPNDSITFTASAVYDTTFPAAVTNRSVPAAAPGGSISATVIDPRLTISNTLSDTNAGQLVRNESVGSTITIKNTGNTNTTNTFVQATLTNLRNITDIRIGGVLAGSSATVSGTDNNTVKVRIGSDMTATGGKVAVGQEVTVSFSATVPSSPTGSPPESESTAFVQFDNGGVSPKTATAAPLTILGQPVVALDITAAPTAEVERGQSITYTVTATNAASVADATGLEISFPLPAQTAFQSASASGGVTPTAPAVNATTGTIVASFPTVLSGGTAATLTVTVTVLASALQVENTIISPEPNDIPASATAQFGPGSNTPVGAKIAHELKVAQLVLTNTMEDITPTGVPPADQELLAGEVVQNRITVKNQGGSNANSSVLSVTLTNLEAPTEVRIDGADLPAQHSYNTTTKVLEVRLGTGAGASGGAIAPNAEIVVTFKSAVVASPTGGTPSTRPVARTSAAVTYTNGGLIPPPAVAQLDIFENPSVSLLITADPAAPGPVPVDGKITYTITATNAPGKGKAKNVALQFPIPANTTFFDADAGGNPTLATPAVGSGGNVTVTFANINPNGAASLLVTVDVVDTPTKVAGSPIANSDTPPNDIVATATATYGPGTNPQAVAPNVAHEISGADLHLLSVEAVPTEIQKKNDANVTATVKNLGPNAAKARVVFTLTGTGTLSENSNECTVDSATQVTCTSSAAIAKDAEKTFTIQAKAPDVTSITVSATVFIVAPEIDDNPGNNGPLSASVGFLQSKSDLTVVGTPEDVELDICPPGALPDSGYCGAPEQVTFTLTAVDPGEPGPGNSTKNAGDDVELAVATLNIPAGLTATVSSGVGCAAPLASLTGSTITCTVGTITTSTPVNLVVSLQGTALLTDAQVTIDVTAANINPSVVANPHSPGVTGTRSDTVVVDVVKQRVDLSVNTITSELLTTAGPLVETITKDYTVRVTNGSADYRAGTYTLTVDTFPAVADTVLALTTENVACTNASNVVTCSVTDLAQAPAGNTRDFVIKAEIKAPGPVTIRSTVVLTSTSTQVDPGPGINNTTWTLERNLPPNAQADVGPTVPAGSTLLFSVLDNDTDGDATDLPNLRLHDLAVTPGGSGVEITVVDGTDCSALAAPHGPRPCFKVVVAPNQAPVTLDVAYDVRDGRGTNRVGSTGTSFKVKVVPPFVPTVEGSFGDPVANPPRSFGNTVPMSPVKTAIDILGGDLRTQADGTPLPSTGPAGSITYDLRTVDGPTAVDKATAVVVPAGDRNIVDYSPSPGYTTDALSIPNPPAAAPPDSFSYTATGKKDDRVLFTMKSTAAVNVRNQLPIGVDGDLVVVPNTGPSVQDPLGNDIDGNTVPAPIDVADRGPLSFNDKAALAILCIGPRPADAAVPPTPTTCDDPAMKKAGVDLTVAAPNGTGSITAQLAKDSNTDLGITANRTVIVTPDGSVRGDVPFAAVIVDGYGGSGWSPVDVVVSNQDPELIAGVPAVPKNSPPTQVIDSKDAGRDANGDLVRISTFTQPEHGKVFVKDETILMYEPDRDYVGPDSLILGVADSGNGSNQARLNIDVVEAAAQPVAAEVTDPGGGGNPPAGSLATTGGDPLALTVAGTASLLLGFILVQASRRRRTIPLLAGARHLRT